jgi:hypothetical protein
MIEHIVAIDEKGLEILFNTIDLKKLIAIKPGEGSTSNIL